MGASVGDRGATTESTASTLGTPSRFWRKLGAEHAAELERYGFDQAKRHLALHYYNWRWNWGSVARSRQMRFLLAHTTPQTWLRCAMAAADLSDSV